LEAAEKLGVTLEAAEKLGATLEAVEKLAYIYRDGILCRLTWVPP
jgi:hypothetical protein